jgi:hypothetical protein
MGWEETGQFTGGRWGEVDIDAKFTVDQPPGIIASPALAVKKYGSSDFSVGRITDRMFTHM